MRQKSPLERELQRRIELELGAEPDLLLLRNSCGLAEYYDAERNTEWHVPYGLGEGSPDLVGLLTMQWITGRSSHARGERIHFSAPVAVWFCLEVKTENGVVSPEQKKCHAIWRRFGCFIEVVRSVKEARAALERARGMAA